MYCYLSNVHQYWQNNTVNDINLSISITIHFITLSIFFYHSLTIVAWNIESVSTVHNVCVCVFMHTEHSHVCYIHQLFCVNVCCHSHTTCMDVYCVSYCYRFCCCGRIMETKPRTARPRLQRSERVFSESHLTSWELFVRDSLLTLAWPDLLSVVTG